MIIICPHGKHVDYIQFEFKVEVRNFSMRRSLKVQFPSLQDISLILNVMQSVIQKIIMYFMYKNAC